MKCVWCKWIGGTWRCTHPSNGMMASEFCTYDGDDAEAVGKDYCPDYYPEQEAS